MKTYIKPTLKEIEVSMEMLMNETSPQIDVNSVPVQGDFEVGAKEDNDEGLW